jgi:hypothetical protein
VRTSEEIVKTENIPSSKSLEGKQQYVSSVQNQMLYVNDILLDFLFSIKEKKACGLCITQDDFNDLRYIQNMISELSDNIEKKEIRIQGSVKEPNENSRRKENLTLNEMKRQLDWAIKRLASAFENMTEAKLSTDTLESGYVAETDEDETEMEDINKMNKDSDKIRTNAGYRKKSIGADEDSCITDSEVSLGSWKFSEQFLNETKPDAAESIDRMSNWSVGDMWIQKPDDPDKAKALYEKVKELNKKPGAVKVKVVPKSQIEWLRYRSKAEQMSEESLNDGTSVESMLPAESVLSKDSGLWSTEPVLSQDSLLRSENSVLTKDSKQWSFDTETDFPWVYPDSDKRGSVAGEREYNSVKREIEIMVKMFTIFKHSTFAVHCYKIYGLFLLKYIFAS